jgi:hypothetical protein
LPTGSIVALGVAAVLACSRPGHDEDDNQFREDVIWCEEALARLATCCPGFDATRVECNYYFEQDEGCTATTTRQIEPALTTGESRCVRDTDCAVLVSSGVCARAQVAVSPKRSSEAPAIGAPALEETRRGPTVCP